ncbi:N-acetylglucosaminyldiphosphodolichol N-acetylglucosaminyltransferase catalytic subunit alg13 [Perkinsus olseni]|uniref:UDP-N-acetylglucosamine transferase subunit ALG13 n=1 Tax=Perkinsus olseni TaxID=32597 RepID=A0A7J6M4H9_PEROL|nr:N-acetylglucosaminyldiphosphodolichol N-acetylglucosaminyltransferase catalytic subunit alg13 [Perkinsus olseni]
MDASSTLQRVFVTVGTTKFDSLVQSVCEPDFLDFLHDKLGTREVVIQYGNSSAGTLKVYEEAKQAAAAAAMDGMAIHGYSLKPEGINDDIQRADLVISHAGAGSIMDTLKVSRERGNERKPILCVVCNKALMGNHQQELANAMRPYALVADGPEELETVLSSLKDSLPKLKVYQKPDGMQRLVDVIYNMFL